MQFRSILPFKKVIMRVFPLNLSQQTKNTSFSNVHSNRLLPLSKCWFFCKRRSFQDKKVFKRNLLTAYLLDRPMQELALTLCLVYHSPLWDGFQIPKNPKPNPIWKWHVTTPSPHLIWLQDCNTQSQWRKEKKSWYVTFRQVIRHTSRFIVLSKKITFLNNSCKINSLITLSWNLFRNWIDFHSTTIHQKSNEV